MKFNFQFGNRKRTIWDYAFWSIVLFSLVGFLSTKFNIPKNTIWRWIDQIQRELVKHHLLDQNNPINELTIKTPELLDNRVKGDVDDAIRDYQSKEPSDPPRMTNKGILKALESPRFTDTQRLIVRDAIYYECPGGVMGIRAVWVDKDPECVDK
jgi:hypothetical protein